MGAKTLTEMLVDMRLDLKDSGSLWSDPELTRCVKKAVGDLSRFFPRQKIKEIVTSFTVTSESITTPAAADPDLVVDAYDLESKTAGQTCTLTGSQPDMARPIKITVTDANTSITAFTIIVKGVDEEDDYQEESFYWHNGLVQTGVKLFKRVTEVELDAITGNAAGDTLDVGTASSVGVPVELDYKPVKPGETVSNTAGTTTYTKNTDYTMDYSNGKLMLKSGGSMADATEYYISYTRSKIAIDLSSITDLIRVERVEYPTDETPQSFITFEIFGRVLTVTGGPNESQETLSESKQLVVMYQAQHAPPGTSAYASYPDFLEFTVELAAIAYALFMKATQHEHQAVTDQASARTALGNLTAAHTAAGNALVAASAAAASATSHAGDAITALGVADAKLDAIETDIASLRTAVNTALDAANAYLDEVDTTDLVGAEGVWTEQVKHILTAAGIPNAEDFLETGDDLINAMNKGPEVPRIYGEYSQIALKMSDAWADKRKDFLSGANVRANAALAFVQEALARLQNINTYIQQAGGYSTIAGIYPSIIQSEVANATTYANIAASYVNKMDAYLNEAIRFNELATQAMLLADKFRADGTDKRNEAWAIWRDPAQFVGDFSLSSGRQPPSYS